MSDAYASARKALEDLHHECGIDLPDEGMSLLALAGNLLAASHEADKQKLVAVTDERDALLEALENGGLPHSCSDGCTRPLCVTRREWDALAKENIIIRGQLSSVKCPYGHKSTEGVCLLGYPGCACADDWYAAQDEMHKAMCEQLAAVAAERDALKASNLQLVTDLRREMDRHDFREARARVNAALENTPL